VRPINLALTTDEITAVSGILNGTSNYILTKMRFGHTYAEALKDATEKGYAEADPSADVSGLDARRKLAILLSLATGKQVDDACIHTEGIERITVADFVFAHALGCTVKPLGDGRILKEGVEALVAPFLVHREEPLSTVADVFNGVMVQAKVTDSVMFYGRGAGKLPTAGAVVSDMVDIAKHLNRHIMHAWSDTPMPVLPIENYVKRKMLRISYKEMTNELIKIIGETHLISLPDYPNTKYHALRNQHRTNPKIIRTQPLITTLLRSKVRVKG
jgi:homoserine dehydrogenase